VFDFVFGSFSVASGYLLGVSLFCAATQLALQLQQERAQVVCSNKEARKRLARRHSRNAP